MQSSLSSTVKVVLLVARSLCFHLDEKGINVVPRVAWVQCLAVLLDAFRYKHCASLETISQSLHAERVKRYEK